MALSLRTSERNAHARRVLAVFYSAYEETKARHFLIDVHQVDPGEVGMTYDEYSSAADRLVDLDLLERPGMSTYTISADGVDVSEDEDRLRDLLPVLSDPSPVEVAPPMSIASAAWTLDVSFIYDDAVRIVLERDIRELAVAQREGLHTAAIVLTGAIGEGILYDALVHRKAMTMAATSAPKDKAGVKDIETDKWSFYAYIEVAKELQILGPSTAQMIHAVLREFRNMIHPKFQVEKLLTPDEAEMKASIAWLEAVARDVRKAP